MDNVDGKDIDQDSIGYMEAHAPKFENASTWVGDAVASPWMPFATVSQPVVDGSL